MVKCCPQEMASATPSGLVLFCSLKYYTTQAKLRSRHKQSTISFSFMEVVITNMCNNCHCLQCKSCIWHVLPAMREMMIGMLLINYRSLFFFIPHFPFSILQETKDGFASPPQRIRRVLPSHLREDLYVASATCCGKRPAREG